MNKETVVSILNDWNYWKKDLYAGVSRDTYIQKLANFLETPQVVVITGPRRAGKSILMRQLAKRLMSQGIDRNAILMVNFEDPRFGELDTIMLQQVYETYLESLQPKQIPYLFLDEVQEVREWEKWVRMMHELGKAKIIISGSNAKLLSHELATLLTGRYASVTVFPLSFRERLFFDGIDVNSDLDFAQQKMAINTQLTDYMDFGSFPHVVLSPEKQQLLHNYFEDVLNKDLIRRFKIRKQAALETLARFYLSNIACPVTFNAAERLLNISADTAEKFSHYFEDAYLFFFLKRFSLRAREREKSPRKVYSIDTGLANAVGFKMSHNKGRLAESIVFLHLLRQQADYPRLSVFYWKDVSQKEIDFVVKDGETVRQLLQVCWDLSDVRTKEREVSALLKGMDALGQREGTIISESFEGEETHDDKTIIYRPLWRWLLA